VEDLFDRLAARFAPDEPGVVFAMLHEGAVVHQGCFGQSEIAWKRPATADSVFAIASLSKPITALLVLKLVEDAAIDLEGRVADYLPDYRGHGADVRVKHLLTHTSGIPNFFLLPGFQDGPVRPFHTNQQLCDVFAPLPLLFEPGSRYCYSNSGYRLLDMIVEAVTGQRFDDVLKERVFIPANMTSSRVLNETDIIPRRATGYEFDGVEWRLASPVSPSLLGGAGGVATSLEDLISFDRALWQDGLASQRVHEQMQTPVRLTSGREEGMGMGWVRTTYRSELVLSFSGGLSGFSSLYCHLPERSASVALLSNRGGLGVFDLATEILDLAFDSPKSTASPSRQPKTSRDWSGFYTDSISRVALRAVPDGYELEDPWQTRLLVHTADLELTEVEALGVTVRLHDEPHAAITINYPLTWFTGYLDAGVRD